MDKKMQRWVCSGNAVYPENILTIDTYFSDKLNIKKVVPSIIRVDKEK